MPGSEKEATEVRVFGRLTDLFEKRNHPISFTMVLDTAITGSDLAMKLGIPSGEIEVIIVNGVVQALQYTIQPGDRVAFVPPGTPGPYRVLLGFINKKK